MLSLHLQMMGDPGSNGGHLHQKTVLPSCCRRVLCKGDCVRIVLGFPYKCFSVMRWLLLCNGI